VEERDSRTLERQVLLDTIVYLLMVVDIQLFRFTLTLFVVLEDLVYRELGTFFIVHGHVVVCYFDTFLYF